MKNQVKTRLLNKITQFFEEINFEFTLLGTPQQNGMIERGFATIYSWIHTMMAHTGIHKNIKTGLRPECTATTTKLKNIMGNPYEEKMCT